MHWNSHTTLVTATELARTTEALGPCLDASCSNGANDISTCSATDLSQYLGRFGFLIAFQRIDIRDDYLLIPTSLSCCEAEMRDRLRCHPLQAEADLPSDPRDQKGISLKDDENVPSFLVEGHLRHEFPTAINAFTSPAAAGSTAVGDVAGFSLA
jgi:hypothetical protein